MTRRSREGTDFYNFAGSKVEVDKKLLEDFSQACAYFEVKRTDVMRHLMAEFVEEARQHVLKGAEEQTEQVVDG